VRQQWNFGPPNSVREVEEYRVELSGVTVLELVIVPDIQSRIGSRLAQEFAVVVTAPNSFGDHCGYAWELRAQKQRRSPRRTVRCNTYRCVLRVLSFRECNVARFSPELSQI
jgi:hypothetical protein